MKIIDLLNKIANGEEVPKKIKLNEIIFEYQGDDYLFIDKDNTSYWLFSEPYSDKFEYLENFLKSEVEILEEKKIPEKLKTYYDVDLEEYVVETYIKGVNYKEIFNSRYDEMIISKINEVLDYLESKGKGE